jgi:DNA-binding MarR family transcriptional regulator
LQHIHFVAAKKQRKKALFRKTVWADEVVIRAIRLGDALSMRLSQCFAEFGITALQYNILRILYVRDETGEGLPSGTLGARLMVRVPDVSRLLDRLERAGLIERHRSGEDRRVVTVRLTRAGSDLVEKVHDPLVARNVELLAHVSQSKLEALAKDLSQVLDGLS